MRLDDLGLVTDSIAEQRTFARFNGTPVVGVSIVRAKGASDVAVADAVATRIEAIKAAHPDLTIRFSSAYSGFLLDWLQKGDLDLMLSYNPQPLRTLRVTPVMVESLMFVSAGAGQLNLDRPVPFAALADVDLILPSPRHGLRGIVEACARRAGIEIPIGL